MRTSRRFTRAAVVLCAAVALSACTTMGTGTGSVSPSNEPVTFSWKSTDGGVGGTLSAALKDGQTFSGPYLQVTSTTQSQAFDPLWTGWEYGWGGWGGFGPFPGTPFPTPYSRPLMANLQTVGGQDMRCPFHL